jgi:N-acetylglucosaminyldiphosphoundecaprenol N-acetyl-beta-D-mannosaminyltransferase
MRVDATSYQDAVERVVAWAERGESRYVCVATVNNVMEGHDRQSYQAVVNRADLVTPDGMPLVWGLRLLGVPDATRVYGPDLTPFVCARAADRGIRVGFFGGTPEVLESLVQRMQRLFPSLHVAYRRSPPFRSLSPDEDRAMVEEIRRSGARIVFVGLGTPKQELWMASHRDQLGAVLLGVGAAFDFLAGTKRQAPTWMRAAGLEWFFRLCQEPRRLWRRYLYGNPRFIAMFGVQVIRERLAARRHGQVEETREGRS